MNILYFCADRGIPVLGFKGASVHIREMVRAWKATGHHHVVIVCVSRGEGNPPPSVEIIEIPPLKWEDAFKRESWYSKTALSEEELVSPVVLKDLQKVLYDEKMFDRVMDKLDQHQFSPDAIYERYSLFQATGIHVARAFDVPHFLEVNAPLIEEEEKYRSLGLKEIAREREKEVFRSTSRVVCVSDGIRDYVLKNGVDPVNATVIANGVDIERFKPDIDPQQVLKEFHIKGKIVVGFVGSLKPWHGVEFLIDSFQAICKQAAEVVLMIVGEGPLFALMREKVKRMNMEDRIFFTGSVPYEEIPRMLAAVDFTAAPYYPCETFYFSPLKVVESMAAGKAVIAPKIGQLELLIDHGVNGLLYSSGNRDEFIHQVLDLTSRPEKIKELGRMARIKAVEHFSWQKKGSEIIHLIEQEKKGFSRP